MMKRHKTHSVIARRHFTVVQCKLRRRSNLSFIEIASSAFSLLAMTAFLFLLFLPFGATPLSASQDGGFVYDAKGRRDPFVPLVSGAAKVTAGLENIQIIDDVILEGIVWDPQGGSIAILNGVIMKESDRVGIVTIKRIDQKSVTLLLNDEEHSVTLREKEDETGD